ncbi:MAG: glycogen/starch synthase [Bacteroidaceae bacterium]|nr:glycogen/starch synthase [Bacteroidaceae bacterium]
MTESQIRPDYIFEVSWEVCNLVGGIYTVLSTKAKTLQKSNKDKVVFIGPDVWQDKPSPYFIEDNKVTKGWLEQARLPYGLKVRTGRWDIPGNPIVILVDFKPLYDHKNELYRLMWDLYGVDSMPAYGDYDEASAFAWASALVIENYYLYINGKEKNVVAHFNEWTTAMGMLYLKHFIPGIATLFTTHATSMGRSIAGNNKPLYDYLAGYNGDQMAQELNMVSKHSVEKRAALHADCFTTVSDITARECAQLLERTPDVVTPNGFERNFVPTKKDMPAKRNAAREKLLNVVQSLTGHRPADDAFLIATSGRYEYRNKGIDLYIDAVARMAQRNDLDREIIAFVLTPGWVDTPRADLLQRMAQSDDYNTPLHDPIITHHIHNYDSDNIVNQIHWLGLNNHPDSFVKIVFIPSYLTGNDGLLNMPYYDILVGMDATAFPSYYEPWGYTPLESVAFGIPTVTTQLSGFGQWVISHDASTLKATGVEVLRRYDDSFIAVSQQLADTIVTLSKMSKKEKTAIDNAASKLAAEAEWKNFIVHYQQAYDIALRRAQERKQ